MNVKQIVKQAVKQAIEWLKNGTEEYASDAAFEAAEWAWNKLGMPYGRIDRWPKVPDPKVLVKIAKILSALEEWIPDDEGLWAGLHPYAALGSMAFFAIENAIIDELYKRGYED